VRFAVIRTGGVSSLTLLSVPGVGNKGAPAASIGQVEKSNTLAFSDFNKASSFGMGCFRLFQFSHFSGTLNCHGTRHGLR
jgi:hypothetical protein